MAASICCRSSSSSVKPQSRALSSMWARSPSRAPTITAATPGCCITKRVATLAIDTRCRSATWRAARSTRCSASHPPATRRKRPYFICDQVPCRSQSGSAAPSHRSRQPAAAQRAVGEQRHVELLAHRGQRAGGTTVDERRAHLVRHDRDAARQHQPQVGGVDVGEPEVADEALALQLVQVEQARRATPDRRSSRRGTAAGRWPARAGAGAIARPRRAPPRRVTGPGGGTHLVNSCTCCPPSPSCGRARPAMSSAEP